VHRIVGDPDEQVLALLIENCLRLDGLANALLEHETLDEADAYAAVGVTPPAAPPPRLHLVSQQSADSAT
jgi:cell division protease FtsH